jgi:hypothetical protein
MLAESKRDQVCGAYQELAERTTDHGVDVEVHVLVILLLCFCFPIVKDSVRSGIDFFHGPACP